MSTSDGRIRAVDLDRGTNQNGVRLYNERLVLSLIRRNGAMPKAEIARLTGLSAQTISVIVTQLAADGLVQRQAPQRGRVGQPSVPFSLNPEGAYAFGLKIGRRSADLVLIDFLGNVRQRVHTAYAYPLPGALLDFAAEGADRMFRTLSNEEQARISGIGIASPYQLWAWAYEVGSPPGALEIWRTTDIRSELEARLGHAAFLCNDATAACAAELVFGDKGGLRDFLYLFVGSFIGGGLVMNGALVPGPSGNAGAIGSMPVPGSNGQMQQLIRRSSLYLLESRLMAAGKDAGWLWADPASWTEAGDELDEWIQTAAEGIAHAVTAATAVYDFPATVIDGAFPVAVRTRLVKAVSQTLDRFDRQGLSPVTILPGSIGSGAREIGGASLPFFANFAMDREVLLKESA